jgi:hypothetical protein
MRGGLRRSAVRRLGSRPRCAAIAAVTAAGVAGLIAPLVDPPARMAPETTVEAQADPAVHRHENTAGHSEPTSGILADQLAVARRVALRWPTAGDASADGWRLAAPYSSHIGAHYLRFPEVDGTFDIARPEMLLYAGDSTDSPIVGLAYYVKFRKPIGFVGSADHWHQHLDVCIGPSGPVQGADAVGVCATNQADPGRWAWMLHAWVIPGWENPAGVFSAENLRLK